MSCARRKRSCQLFGHAGFDGFNGDRFGGLVFEQHMQSR